MTTHKENMVNCIYQETLYLLTCDLCNIILKILALAKESFLLLMKGNSSRSSEKNEHEYVNVLVYYEDQVIQGYNRNLNEPHHTHSNIMLNTLKRIISVNKTIEETYENSIKIPNY
jgi:hypothetical protein